MNFNVHSNLVGHHAFLSASNSAWVNYEDDKLERVFFASEEAKRGTELHEFAQRAIKLRIRQVANQKSLNQYINDAIGFRMTPEQTLYYSENAFGTADAIGFEKEMLRIHDLKNGKLPATPRQLEVYAALFCLEYHHDPRNIGVELRIYQNNEIRVIDTNPAAIIYIMEKIKSFDKRIRFLRLEVSN